MDGDEDTIEGWAWPTGARDAHYIVNRRSLCGRFAYSGDETILKPTKCCRRCADLADERGDR